MKERYGTSTALFHSFYCAQVSPPPFRVVVTQSSPLWKAMSAQLNLYSSFATLFLQVCKPHIPQIFRKLIVIECCDIFLQFFVSARFHAMAGTSIGLLVLPVVTGHFASGRGGRGREELQLHAACIALIDSHRL
jgi:hypothetical protein